MESLFFPDSLLRRIGAPAIRSSIGDGNSTSLNDLN
jgi:hypothetical protein